jgi:DNA-binding transcriptional MerR regulator
METPTRLLSIGEFSAATQLSPKALRLYDEQRLLPPAHTDTANGYRYYQSEQVARGRLIRTLRDMGLALTDIAIVINAQSTRVEALLDDFAREQDKQRAREKRAFQSALMMLRHKGGSDVLDIVERNRPEMTCAVRSFVATRDGLIAQFRKERHALEASLANAQTLAIGESYCALLDPLSDESGRLEVMIPIKTPSNFPADISIRQLPIAQCAAISIDNRHEHATDFTGALDAMFDWFDRRGVHAVDVPLVSFVDSSTGLRADILWAYAKATEG